MHAAERRAIRTGGNDSVSEAQSNLHMLPNYAVQRRTLRGGEEYKEKNCILFLNCNPSPPNFQDLIITAGTTNNSHTRGFNGCRMLIKYEPGCFADGPLPMEFFVIQKTQGYNLFGGLFKQTCCPQTSGKVMALI